MTGFVGETAKGGDAKNGGNEQVATGNHAPDREGTGNKTIPIRTPFTLKGSGKDADGGKLTYLWEQLDIGGANGIDLVSNKKVYGPLFRMFGDRLRTSPTRGRSSRRRPGRTSRTATRDPHFPDLAQVLAGNTNAKTGKCPAAPPLPPDDAPPPPVRRASSTASRSSCRSRSYVGTAGSKTPAMHFRLTARDGFDNGGGVGLRRDHAPDRPNAGRSWSRRSAAGGSVKAGARPGHHLGGQRHQEAGQEGRILLSTNGGKTWTKKLVRATPNDGRAKIQIPRVSTHRARIMISAIGNYFYDVNDKRFTIRK